MPRENIEPWIQTWSGGKFDLIDPTPEMIDIMDIAKSLSKQCRFNGHTTEFYSVAQHSVELLKYYLDENEEEYDIIRNGDPDVYGFLQKAMTILLHDASEAYIGDMTSPLKILMPDFKKIEYNIDMVIADKFDTIFPHPPWLKTLDIRVLLDERASVMTHTLEDWKLDVEPLGIHITPWPVGKAYSGFINYFHHLNHLSSLQT